MSAEPKELPLEPLVTNGKGGVFAKILAVMGDVSHVVKDGMNQMQRYAYSSEYGVISAIRQSMIKHGLVIIPSVESVETRDVGETKSGTMQRMTTVTMKYAFVDAETGDKFEACFAGVGIDVGDKGIYKAITGANKYAILKSFQLPTGDDPEADESTDRNNSGENKSTKTDKPPKSSAHHPDDLKQQRGPGFITETQETAIEDLIGKKQMDKELEDWFWKWWHKTDKSSDAATQLIVRLEKCKDKKV